MTFNEIYVMLRLAKTVRDIKLSKSKKEKGGLSNESKEVENESSWSLWLSALHLQRGLLM